MADPLEEMAIVGGPPRHRNTAFASAVLFSNHAELKRNGPNVGSPTKTVAGRYTRSAPQTPSQPRSDLLDAGSRRTGSGVDLLNNSTFSARQRVLAGVRNDTTALSACALPFLSRALGNQTGATRLFQPPQR